MRMIISIQSWTLISLGKRYDDRKELLDALRYAAANFAPHQIIRNGRIVLAMSTIAEDSGLILMWDHEQVRSSGNQNWSIFDCSATNFLIHDDALRGLEVAIDCVEKLSRGARIPHMLPFKSEHNAFARPLFPNTKKNIMIAGIPKLIEGSREMESVLFAGPDNSTTNLRKGLVELKPHRRGPRPDVRGIYVA